MSGAPRKTYGLTVLLSAALLAVLGMVTEFIHTSATSIIGASLCLLSLPLLVIDAVMATIDYARRRR